MTHKKTIKKSFQESIFRRDLSSLKKQSNSLVDSFIAFYPKDYETLEKLKKIDKNIDKLVRKYGS